MLDVNALLAGNDILSMPLKTWLVKVLMQIVTTSFLYVLALLHLVHVFAGVIVLIVVFVNNKNKKYNDETLGFELAETFWHFLGFLWLYLFVFLYFFR